MTDQSISHWGVYSSTDLDKLFIELRENIDKLQVISKDGKWKSRAFEIIDQIERSIKPAT